MYFSEVENTTTDILIIGNSLYALSLALQLGKAKKEVLITEILQEHPVRGFYKIGKTSLNDVPIEGHTFDDMIFSRLNKLGVSTKLNIYIDSGIDYDKASDTFTVHCYESTIVAKKIVYAPNIITKTDTYPLTSKKVQSFEWSACAWSDSYFYKHQKTGVYGNGSWSANQALNAHLSKNDVTIYNPDATFIADDFLLDELEQSGIRIVNNCNDFQLISDSEKGLAFVTYTCNGEQFKEVCKLVYEGRANNIVENPFGEFPEKAKFFTHKIPLLTFNHDTEFDSEKHQKLLLNLIPNYSIFNILFYKRIFNSFIRSIKKQNIK